MSTITTAANQYAHRPADERFPSVQALITSAKHDRLMSIEKTINVRDLKALTITDPATGDPTFAIQSPKGVAQMSHWAFGQFARTVGAPAGYLRDLPPSLCAANINHGISVTHGDVNLLVKANAGVPLIRAATSDSYGRVWDADLYTACQEQIFAHGSSRDSSSGWVLPPTWSGESAGAYRGDRDSFLIQVDGGSIVENPSIGSGAGSTGTGSISRPGGRPMYRGVMIGNSEVGKSSLWIDCVLFDYVCGNHMLWGAVIDQSFRRRHVGTRTLRDTLREISRIAYSWAKRSAEQDASIIRSLMAHEIAVTKDAVVDELRKLGATKDVAERAYDLCERHESASPRSFWGAAAGLTRLSQESGFQDERYDLDKIAAQIMRLGSRVKV